MTRYKQLSAENAAYKARHAVTQWLVFNENDLECANSRSYSALWNSLEVSK